MKRLLSLLCVLLAVGCRPATPPDPPARPRPHPADAVVAARHLSSDSAAVLLIPDLTCLARRIGVRTLMERRREGYEQAVFGAMSKLGVNPFSPSELARMGVDAHGSAALAVLDARWRHVAIVVELAQEDRFKTELYRVASARRGWDEPRVRGSAVVIGEDDLAVVVRDSVALAVTGPDASSQADRLAELPEREQLRWHAPFRAALAAIDGDHDLTAYLDPRALAYASFGLDPRWPGTSYAEAARHIEREHRAALARTRDEGASVEAIVQIDERYRTARENLDDEPQTRTVRRMLGGVGGLGLGVRLRDDGFDLTASLSVDPATAWLGWVRSRTTTSPLLAALAGEPAAVLGLSVDMSVIQAESEKLAVEPVTLVKLLGVSLDQRIDQLLSGPFDLVLTLDDAAGDGATRLGGAAVVGLRDAAAMRSLLDRLAGTALLDKHLSKQPDGWTVKVAPLPDVHFRLLDRNLVAATDPALFARLARPAASAAPRRGALGLGQLGPGAIDLGLDLRLPVAWSALESRLSQRRAAEAAPPPPDEPAARAAKRAALAKLEARIAELELGARERRSRAELSAARELGTMAASVRRSEVGLSLALSYTTAGSTPMTAVLDAIDRLERVANAEPDDSEHELDRLRKERWELVIELGLERPR